MAEDIVLYAITAGFAVLAILAGLIGRTAERRSESRYRDERLTAALTGLHNRQSSASRDDAAPRPRQLGVQGRPAA